MQSLSEKKTTNIYLGVAYTFGKAIQQRLSVLDSKAVQGKTHRTAPPTLNLNLKTYANYCNRLGLVEIHVEFSFRPFYKASI